jgi:hypothetical protein
MTHAMNIGQGVLCISNHPIQMPAPASMAGVKTGIRLFHPGVKEQVDPLSIRFMDTWHGSYIR